MRLGIRNLLGVCFVGGIPAAQGHTGLEIMQEQERRQERPYEESWVSMRLCLERGGGAGVEDGRKSGTRILPGIAEGIGRIVSRRRTTILVVSALVVVLGILAARRVCGEYGLPQLLPQGCSGSAGR